MKKILLLLLASAPLALAVFILIDRLEDDPPRPESFPPSLEYERQARLAQESAARRERAAEATIQAQQEAAAIALAAAATTTTHYHPPSTTTTTRPPAAVHDSSGVNWDAIAECESGGDWHINTGNGYYGGLQFNLQTWRGVGGTGYPHEHSREEQIYRAEILYSQRGVQPWPVCGKYG
jgi:hypothetical protein